MAEEDSKSIVAETPEQPAPTDCTGIVPERAEPIKSIKEQTEEIYESTYGKVKIEFSGGFLRDMAKCINVLTDEVVFHINARDMRATLVDPAHVAMSTWLIDRDDTIEWLVEPDEGDEVILALDVGHLLAFLTKRIRNEDRVQLLYDLHKGQKATNDKGKSPKFKFPFALKSGNFYKEMEGTDPTGIGQPKVPDLRLDAKITIQDSRCLGIGSGFLNNISDHVIVKAGMHNRVHGQDLPAEINCLSFEAEGDKSFGQYVVPGAVVVIQAPHVVRTNGTGRILGDKEEPREGESITTDVRQYHRSLFPLEYFHNIMEAIPTGPVELFMGTDYPIRICHNFSCHSKVEWLLAPRIESGD